MKICYPMEFIMLKIINHESILGTKTKSTKLQIYELVIFNQTTKIDTHGEKHFHSNLKLNVSGVLFMLSDKNYRMKLNKKMN